MRLRAKGWSTVVVASGLLWGCSGSPAPGAPGAAAAIRSFVTGTSGGLTLSFATMEAEVARNPTKLRDAAIPLVSAPQPSVRFGAIYALSLTADTAASRHALAPVLESNDITERLLAAEALLRGGDTSALPVVIDALGSDQPMEFWDPPMPVWRFARLLLHGATGLDFGLESAQNLDQAVVAKGAWVKWWHDSGPSYHIPAGGPAS